MGRIRAKLGRAKDKAGTAIKETEGPSPNPMTNLIITDIALRGTGRLIRNLFEKNMLGVKYPADQAKALVSGRGMAQTLVGTAIARVATRSVPGALLVGGGLLAKAIYDRRHSGEAREKGATQIEKRTERARRREKL